MDYTKVKNIDHLKSICENKTTDFFIWLNGLRSSKDITYEPEYKIFYVFHNIDDTENTYTEKELEESNIGIAIKAGNFYKY